MEPPSEQNEPRNTNALKRLWNELSEMHNPVDEFGPERRPDFFVLVLKRLGQRGCGIA